MMPSGSPRCSSTRPCSIWTSFHLASGAGHDAGMFAGITDIGMLFVRCGNGDISHSPLETVTEENADVAARVPLDVLVNLG